jgi:hypothetical protein
MFGVALKKHPGVVAIISLVILLVGLLIWRKTGVVDLASRQGPAAILFWGDTCPHCHDLMAGDIYRQAYQTLNITTKETWNNLGNAAEMETAFANCVPAVPDVDQGVPFLYVAETNTCAVGLPEIEALLTQLMAAPETSILALPETTQSAEASPSVSD